MTEGKLNPYNIYGKCYNFDDSDLNDTLSTSETSRRRLGEASFSPRGFTVKDYAPWSLFNYADYLFPSLHSNNKNKPLLRSSPQCSSGKPIAEYLNEPRIRRQLNIPEEASQMWDFCNDHLNDAY